MTLTNELVCNHQEELWIWREYNATDKALKQQLLGVYDKMYLKTLQNRHMGFANVTTKQMLWHLYDNYGVITPTEHAENDMRMKKIFDSTMLIENLYEQIENAVEFAEAGNAPYMNAQIIATAYSLIFQQGVYSTACRK